MKQVILNTWQENRSFFMINQMQIMILKLNLSIIQKFQNLIYVIARMLTF